MNGEAKEWIERQIANGVSTETIRKQLSGKGWSEPQINEALSSTPSRAPQSTSKKMSYGRLGLFVGAVLLVGIIIIGFMYFSSHSTGSTSSDTKEDVLQVGNEMALDEIPATLTYDKAKITGRQYKCSFRISSFFGEQNPAEAEIRGEDFIIAEELSLGEPIMYAKIGNTGYSWICYDIKQEDGSIEKRCDGTQFDIRRLDQLFEEEIGKPFPMDIPLMFTKPPETADCKLIKEANITLPEGVVFNDTTEIALEMLRGSIEQEREKVGSFLFDVYLPEMPEVFTHTETEIGSDYGITDPERDSIDFIYRQKDESKKQMHFLRIDESKVSTYFDPPTNCQQIPSFERDDGYPIEEKKYPCSLLSTTPSGREIYMKFGFPMNGFTEKEYFVKIDNTLLISTYTVIDGEETHYEWADGELEAFIDSMTKISEEDLLSIRSGEYYS